MMGGGGMGGMGMNQYGTNMMGGGFGLNQNQFATTSQFN